MSFRAKAMKVWNSNELQAFFRSRETLADDLRKAIVAVCANNGLSGEDVVSPDAEEGLLELEIAKPLVAMIVELANEYKGAFPERGAEDPNPMFDLTYETAKGKQQKIRVQASDSVAGLKKTIAMEEHYPNWEAVRLMYNGKPMLDKKSLRDHALTHKSPARLVSVVFGTKGGAEPGGDDTDDELISAMLRFRRRHRGGDGEDGAFRQRMREHRRRVRGMHVRQRVLRPLAVLRDEGQVGDWMRQLPAALLAEVPALCDRAKLSEEAMLAMTDEQWAKMIPKRVYRRKFLKALGPQRRKMARRVALRKKRTLPTKNPLVKRTMKADVVPGTEDADAFFRAEMPCGHAIGPNNLFRYFYAELMEKMGTTVLKCPEPCCPAEWPWHVVFAVCGLSPAEAGEYQRVLDDNVLQQSTRPCPHCATRCDKPASITHCRVRCVTCHGRDFCWECGRAWEGVGFQKCGNEGCDITDRVNKVLASCADKKFNDYKDVVGPSIRMCPRPGCKTLVEHTRACKHMKCPTCKKEFCFFCLRLQSDAGAWECGSHTNKCTMAPRQHVTA